MKKIAFPFTVLIGLTSLAQARPMELEVGEPFVKARIRLYTAGWRADPLSHATSGEYMGLDRVLIRNGYLEVDSCSIGKTFCILQYMKEKTCLRVYTKGEQIHSMKIMRWSDECREHEKGEQKNLLPADVRYLMQWEDDCDNFNQCNGIKNYLRTLKRKYAQDLEIMEILKTYSE